MSAAKQSQRAEEGSSAYQGGRDVIVHQGLSKTDMLEILEHTAKTIAVYVAEGDRRAQERYATLRDEIIEEFGPGRSGNREAFNDPDFQYMIGDAQVAYARSGDEAVCDTLVDIIVQRSRETHRTRLALTLNDAAIVAPQLTKEEFSTLSVVFVMRYSKVTSYNLEQAISVLISKVFPLLSDAGMSESSFRHIQAKSCGTLDVRQVMISDLLKISYGGVMCRGVTRDDLRAIFPGREEAFDDLLVKISNDPDKFRLMTGHKEDFSNAALNKGIASDDIEKIWQLVSSAVLTCDELCNIFSLYKTQIRKLFTLWDGGNLKNLTLTNLGMAIGYANARAVVGIDAPLSMWIT